MRCVTAVGCEKLVVDQNSKSISCFGILDELHTIQWGQVVAFNLLFITQFSEAELSQKFEAQYFINKIDPSSWSPLEEVFTTPWAELGISGQRNNVIVEGVQLPNEPGTYEYRLRVKCGEAVTTSEAAIPVKVVAAQFPVHPV